MKKFTIIRLSISNIIQTFGVFLDEGLPFAVTLEKPWLNNQKEISCIPCGDYICKRVNSPKFGNTFQVTDVLGRSEILFHAGNFMKDTHGCIILGEQFEPLNGENAVIASGKAMSEFLQRTNGIDEFRLSIREFIL